MGESIILFLIAISLNAIGDALNAKDNQQKERFGKGCDEYKNTFIQPIMIFFNYQLFGIVPTRNFPYISL